MRKRVYIAGKVTGEDRDSCYSKFKNAQTKVEEKGFDAVNPLKLIADRPLKWEEAMAVCLVELHRCDLIYLLPDWVDSPGARLEAHYARRLDIKTLSEDE